MINFDNSFYKLNNKFFIEVNPTEMPSPKLVQINTKLAEKLKIDINWLKSKKGVDAFTGRALPKGSKPISMVYAGHQFGNWVPRLGDGRAILLGETIDKKNCRWDIQIKGGGRTPFSRNGDGRATIGPVLREYLISEYINTLKIPSTRALSAFITGEKIRRETSLPGAILTRVAKSHVRVGSFQYYSSIGDLESIKTLTNYIINRHYKNILNQKYLYKNFLSKVINRQAKLISKWMSIGFIHGVMNTDNTSIIGDTIDYGPCAFMDYYDPKIVHSSIDTYGRYSFKNQPNICHWNLCQFASSILHLLDKNDSKAIKIAQKEIDKYPKIYKNFWFKEMKRKLFINSNLYSDETIIKDLLDIMNDENLDYTLTFKFIEYCLFKNKSELKKINHLFLDCKNLKKWIYHLKKRLEKEQVSQTNILNLKTNPSIIPRNHIVETTLNKVIKNNDYEDYNQLFKNLQKPFSKINEKSKFFYPPDPNDDICTTFCGT